MIVEAYAVHDSAVGAYNQPLFFRSRGEAVRAFQDACGKESNFVAHPADYSFFRIGQFDDQTGVFTPVEPERICGANDFTF